MTNVHIHSLYILVLQLTDGIPVPATIATGIYKVMLPTEVLQVIKFWHGDLKRHVLYQVSVLVYQQRINAPFLLHSATL